MKYYIDGNNIGRLVKEVEGKLLLEVVLSLCHHIVLQGDDFVCYFDASGFHNLEEDKKTVYNRLIKSKRFKVAPPRNQADIYILDDATDDVNRGEVVKIISNDLYRDFLEPQHEKYKPEYSRFSWVDPFKGTHHTGNMSSDNNGLTLKILSLNFKIPIEKDVNKLLPLLIPEVIDQESKFKSNPTESNTNTNKVEDKNKTISNKTTEQKPYKVQQINFPRPNYHNEERHSNDSNEAIKLVAKILGPIIFLVILISYTSGNKNEINTSNPTPLQESQPEYNPPSYNHMEDNSSSSYDAEPKQENIPIKQSVNCSNCGGIGNINNKQTYQCGSCSGTGKKICYNCSPIPCPNCNAVGRTTCSNCVGNGFRKCGNCNGNGYIQYYSHQERCGTCNGNGNYKCSNCNGNGFFNCSNCKGNGSVSNNNSGNQSCENCYGTGNISKIQSVTCNICNGSGTITE